MRRSGRRFAMALLVLLVLLALGLSSTPSAANPVLPVEPSSPVPLGTMLPDFAVTAQDGTTFTRADLAPNRPALVVFFVAWSAISQAEAGEIAAVTAMHPDLQVVLIGGPDRETPADVFAFPARFNLPFPAYYDSTMPPDTATDPASNAGTPGGMESAWGITAYPAIVVADATGTVRAGREGFLSMADLNAVVTPLSGTAMGGSAE